MILHYKYTDYLFLFFSSKVFGKKKRVKLNTIYNKWAIFKIKGAMNLKTNSAQILNGKNKNAIEQKHKGRKIHQIKSLLFQLQIEKNEHVLKQNLY